VGLAVLAFGATSSLWASQRAGTGTPPATKSAGPTFVCPDKPSEKACQSFLELWRAGDQGVRVSASDGGLAYVCFRQPDDEFFVFRMSGPWFQKHFDAATKKLVPNDSAVSKGRGFIFGFKDGVEDGSITPISDFEGDWEYMYDAMFTAKYVNRNELAPNASSGVWINPEQVSATWRFKNRVDKNVDYQLVIRRSTGRYTESYLEESSNVPFERNGRCSKIPQL
jgi:hypothetical protein